VRRTLQRNTLLDVDLHQTAIDIADEQVTAVL
jgi:hypothetical protein